MGIPEKVALIIDNEVERKLHEELCVIVEKVSQLYHVPLKIVRNDLMGGVFCSGIKKADGKLCTHRAVMNGFCMKHSNEKRLTEPINSERSGLRHNHKFPSPPQADCPACNASKKLHNQFRDLDSIM
jgi:hypothetical protein